ncbi:hypothetical protein O7626_01190 [Micromonospora sp. WMMD1102]|uniref:hypothetical protein n=1 Tax=Micromonospora sp. WMMD1102 TaxID=3016105 RepID=UPI0024150E13|nr:hypothetical protein [Micromonospora sp. WMMD1102]MDG4784561.1 hypothetical protein [Micromonospora sp. WMMD1102]
MSVEVETAGGRRPEIAGRWSTSLAVAGLAVAVVTAAAQSIDRFHWWAGFVLVPGALVASSGGPLLARGGGRAFVGYLLACVGGLVFAVGALLMFGVMGRGWPFMITLPALAVAGTYFWRSPDPLARAFHRTVALLALDAAALGLTFLLLVNDVLDFGRIGWWGGFVTVAGAVILANGLELLRHRIAYRAQAVTLAVGPAVIAILLGLRFLRDWPFWP